MGVFVAQTTHFQIEVDANLGTSGFTVAMALSQICESDYQRCVSWFGGTQVPYRSPDTPGYIRVLVTTLNGGWNNGSGGFIKVNGYPDVESVGLAFVMELSEMFMDVQNIGWDPSNSKGEALSRLFGEEAHPTAPAAGLFFTAQSWLGTDADPAGSANRHDWVTANEATDTNFISTGCAILFLNYLRWQLGYSLEKIIATKGATLETVFQALTGGSGGFGPFSALLNRFFPIGTRPAVGDNPFPLREPAQRSVLLNAVLVPTGTIAFRNGVVNEGFIGCPIKPYQYTIFAMRNTVKVTATAIGFGIAQFVWTVNGITATDGASIQPAVLVFRPDPELANGGTSSSEGVLLDVSVSGQGSVLTLTLGDPAFNAQAHLTIAVTANDAFDNPASTTTATVGTNIATEVVQFEPSYYQDARRCAQAFIGRLQHKVAPPFDHLAQAIAIILTLPDPPPPEFQRVILVLEQIAFLAQRLPTGFPSETLEQLQQFLARRLAIAHSIGASLEFSTQIGK